MLTGHPKRWRNEQRKQQRAATATAATAETHARIKGLGVSAASTPVARTQTTIPQYFGLMLLASLFFLIFQLAAGKCKEGRWPNRVYCCLTPTCTIRRRQRGQAELEGAMVRATTQTHSRVACSPGCAVDPKDQRIPVEIVQSTAAILLRCNMGSTRKNS